MTTLDKNELRLLALKVLVQDAGSAAGTATLTAAARRAYDDLARVSAPLIGQAGVDALTDRALRLAQQEYPWLAQTREPEHAERPFAAVIVSLERQDPAVASEAAATVFAAFTGLLVTFIGEPLTARLLRQAWPDAWPDPSAREDLTRKPTSPTRLTRPCRTCRAGVRQG